MIDLAGGARTFTLVKASAHLAPGQNRFTALRQFELYACTAGEKEANPTCNPALEDGFRRERHRARSRELIMRTFEVPTTTATHVLFRVLDNQCTGNEHFQGEQDNDTANTTDCRVGALPTLLPRGHDVRAAELEVLSARPSVDGANADE